MLKAGGETEKVGNQYEFNIVTLYYAKLLCDEVLYVQSESCRFVKHVRQHKDKINATSRLLKNL